MYRTNLPALPLSPSASHSPSDSPLFSPPSPLPPLRPIFLILFYIPLTKLAEARAQGRLIRRRRRPCFYYGLKVSPIGWRCLNFEKQVPTLFDFGMSWSQSIDLKLGF